MHKDSGRQKPLGHTRLRITTFCCSNSDSWNNWIKKWHHFRCFRPLLTKTVQCKTRRPTCKSKDKRRCPQIVSERGRSRSLRLNTQAQLNWALKFYRLIIKMNKIIMIQNLRVSWKYPTYQTQIKRKQKSKKLTRSITGRSFDRRIVLSNPKKLRASQVLQAKFQSWAKQAEVIVLVPKHLHKQAKT